MSHASMLSTVHVENMTVTALILMGVLAKAIPILSKRLSKSRLTLETDSFALTMQTKPDSLPQELPPHVQGGNDDGRRDDVHRGIPGIDPGDARTNHDTDSNDGIVRGPPEETTWKEESQVEEGSHGSEQTSSNKKW